jgi:hypothetical protein
LAGKTYYEVVVRAFWSLLCLDTVGGRVDTTAGGAVVLPS